MKRRMDDIVEYLGKSQFRRKVLKVLASTITTSHKVAHATKLQIATVRGVISDLKRKGLVKVVNKKHPRLYEATSLGKTAAGMKNYAGRTKWKGTGEQRRRARRVKEKL